jgi:hypothetical protein
MHDYDYYVARHGEPWVQHLIEEIEFCEGICANIQAPLPLEDRWNAIMQVPQAAAQSSAMAA